MSVTHSATLRFPTSATRSRYPAITAALAVLAGLAVLVLTFGFPVRPGAVNPVVRPVVAADRAVTAGDHKIAMFEKRGYTQVACTKHGTLMRNRGTGQTTVINL